MLKSSGSTKTSRNAPLQWSEAANSAFHKIKTALADATMLSHPKHDADLCLMTDAHLMSLLVQFFVLTDHKPLTYALHTSINRHSPERYTTWISLPSLPQIFIMSKVKKTTSLMPYPASTASPLLQHTSTWTQWHWPNGKMRNSNSFVASLCLHHSSSKITPSQRPTAASLATFPPASHDLLFPKPFAVLFSTPSTTFLIRVSKQLNVWLPNDMSGPISTAMYANGPAHAYNVSAAKSNVTLAHHFQKKKASSTTLRWTI